MRHCRVRAGAFAHAQGLGPSQSWKCGAEDSAHAAARVGGNTGHGERVDDDLVAGCPDSCRGGPVLARRWTMNLAGGCDRCSRGTRPPSLSAAPFLQVARPLLPILIPAWMRHTTLEPLGRHSQGLLACAVRAALAFPLSRPPDSADLHRVQAMPSLRAFRGLFHAPTPLHTAAGRNEDLTSALHSVFAITVSALPLDFIDATDDLLTLFDADH
jgi:hypothetical protein